MMTITVLEITNGIRLAFAIIAANVHISTNGTINELIYLIKSANQTCCSPCDEKILVHDSRRLAE